MNQTLIIVPTYNERDNLPRMAQKLLSISVGVDVLVVDDNSPDGTGRIADELAVKFPQIHVLHRTEKNGLGRAYIAGFKWALERNYEFIFEMDCDFSHNPDDLVRLHQACAVDGADLSIGSRYIKGGGFVNWPADRIFISRVASIYVN